MRIRLLAAALASAALLNGAPAAAREFVADQASMFGASTVEKLNARIGNFNVQTGKEIVVVTVASVEGGDVRTAAENAFAQRQVNGVLIFIDKGDRKDWIVPDRAAVQSGWWSSEESRAIAQAMEAQFKAGDYDGGISTAVASALNLYRSHLNSLPNSGGSAAVPRYAQPVPNGVHISMFWWIIIALVAFFIIRALMRAASGPRSYGGGPGAPGPGYTPGYGPGYGGYGWGGGGGFWSGLLGGLGGAWLGNEMFGRGMGQSGSVGGVDQSAGAAPGEGGGWQSDPGQAGVGGASGGDWGGGGFGGGDSGGAFGGGDSGGGGDAGGGW